MTDNELKEHCIQKAGIDLGRYSYNELNLIKDALRRYHNAKLKLLSISAVGGAKRNLVCPHCKSGEENFTRNGHHIWCRKCDYEFNVD